MAESSNSMVDGRPRARALQVLIAGTNVWFTCSAFPWFFVERPTVLQSVLHALPLVVVLIGATLLFWARARRRIGAHVSVALAVAVPLSVGIAAAIRGEDVNRIAMPGWALLLAVVSLWVFVGALALADTEAAIHPQPTLPVATRERRPWQPGVTRMLAIVAALVTVTIAPNWLSPAEHDLAWGDVAAVGSMLTTAGAIAIGLGILLIVLGPSALTKQEPVLVPLRRRLWPGLALAAVSAVTYLLTKQ